MIELKISLERNKLVAGKEVEQEQDRVSTIKALSRESKEEVGPWERVSCGRRSVLPF